MLLITLIGFSDVNQWCILRKKVHLVNFKILFIYLFINQREREREHKQGEQQVEGEGEGEAGSPLSREPDVGA